MEIEKTLTILAPREQVWAMLLDPQVMGGAVPGMKSIEVISPTEYVAVMHQKISFISAKFKLRTHIVEQRAPEYLRAQGTGEDASVASSLKQTSEVFLAPTPEGGTELRIKVNVDVLGRLGSFGLSVMKTKADRMWEEFGNNLKARIETGGLPAATVGTAQEQMVVSPADTNLVATPSAALVRANEQEPVSAQALESWDPPVLAATPTVTSTVTPAPGSSSVPFSTPAETEEAGQWWSRLLGRGRQTGAHDRFSGNSRTIRVEIRQLDKTVTVEWPLEATNQCRDWLRELTK